MSSAIGCTCRDLTRRARCRAAHIDHPHSKTMRLGERQECRIRPMAQVRNEPDVPTHRRLSHPTGDENARVAERNTLGGADSLRREAPLERPAPSPSGADSGRSSMRPLPQIAPSKCGRQVLEDAAGAGQARLGRPAVHRHDAVSRKQPRRHVIAEVLESDPPVRCRRQCRAEASRAGSPRWRAAAVRALVDESDACSSSPSPLDLLQYGSGSAPSAELTELDQAGEVRALGPHLLEAALAPRPARP